MISLVDGRTVGDEPGEARREVVLRPGSAELDPRRHQRRRRLVDFALGAGVLLSLVSMWQVASMRGWVDPRLYPAPTDVIAEAIDLWNRGILADAVITTTRRVLFGYAIGSVAGVATGLAMGASRPLRAALEPLLDILYTIPKLALVPVFLTIFGFGEKPIVALVSVTVFFFVWISSLAAVLSVDSGYRDSARVMHATRRQMFRHVLFPGALPQIAVGLRVAAGVAVLVVIGVELVIGSSGLGFLISQGRAILLLSQTFVGIVLSGLLGFLFISLIRFLTRILVPWSHADHTPDRF